LELFRLFGAFGLAVKRLLSFLAGIGFMGEWRFRESDCFICGRAGLAFPRRLPASSEKPPPELKEHPVLSPSRYSGRSSGSSPGVYNKKKDQDKS